MLFCPSFRQLPFTPPLSAWPALTGLRTFGMVIALFASLSFSEAFHVPLTHRPKARSSWIEFRCHFSVGGGVLHLSGLAWLHTASGRSRIDGLAPSFVIRSISKKFVPTGRDPSFRRKTE